MNVLNGYKDDVYYRYMLNDLMQAVFGFSFENWYSLGKWDDNYDCYSIFEGGRFVANVGVQKYCLLVGGSSIPAIQLGAVATREECRGCGLSRMLMDIVLKDYSDRGVFLFGDESVLDFYPKFGFKRTDEVQPYVEIADSNERGMVRRIRSDSRILHQHVVNRVHHSARVDVGNAVAVNFFNIIMRFKDDIYYIPEHDAVLIATRSIEDSSKVMVWDVLCSGDMTLDDLVCHLPYRNVKTIEFGFTPDWITDRYSVKKFNGYEHQGYLFTKEIDLGTGFKFPFMAIT